MLEPLLTPSQESCQGNLLKFNSSSFGPSTPGLLSDIKQGMLEFAEYGDGRPIKKHLTIRVDSSYDFDPSKNNISDCLSSPVDLIHQLRMNLSQLSAQNTKLKQQLKEKDTEISSLMGYNQQLQQEHEKTSHAKQDLQRKFDKVSVMNRALQNDLKQSERRILELQKQSQRVLCHTQYDNLVKMKEATGKMTERINMAATISRESRESRDIKDHRQAKQYRQNRQCRQNRENNQPPNSSQPVRKSLERRKPSAGVGMPKKGSLLGSKGGASAVFNRKVVMSSVGRTQ